jgi:GAF domain-containing protein
VNRDASPADWSELVQQMLLRAEEQPSHVLGMLRELLTTGREVINCSETSVMVPDASVTNLQFLVSINSRPEVEEMLRYVSVPCDRSLAGCVFNTGQLIAIANPDQFYQAVDQKTGLQTNIYMVTPMLAGDEVLGVLTFVNRPEGQPPEPFNEVEIEWAQRLADLAAASIKLYRRTQLQRRLFHGELATAAERFAADVRLAMGDADNGDPADESPMAVAIDCLEKMSRREQGLAVEMLRLLSTFDER